MKLLFDENLSRKLVNWLADLFPGSSHVALEGLLQFTSVFDISRRQYTVDSQPD